MSTPGLRSASANLPNLAPPPARVFRAPPAGGTSAGPAGRHVHLAWPAAGVRKGGSPRIRLPASPGSEQPRDVRRLQPRPGRTGQESVGERRGAPYGKMRKPDGKIVLLGDMNVGKTSLLQRYMERRFPDTVSTVGGAFYLKQWRSYNISIWDTAGREQFHGLGSMYCRGAVAVILTYDVNHAQSLLELEDRFLGLTDTASADCLFAVVGNKVDLSEEAPGEGGQGGGHGPGQAGGGGCPAPRLSKQVQLEDAVAFYKKILKYKMLDEKDVPAAEQMCFETSAKTGKNVDLLFETVFDMVVPVILRQRAQGPPQTVDVASAPPPARTRSGCCS